MINPGKPFMAPISAILRKPFEWWAERRAIKDTETYLRLNREYTPEQARRLWAKLKRRRARKWWKF